jgi:hypothetical protein
MGISLETLKCLIYAKKNKVDFTNVATIGRQAIRHKRNAVLDVLQKCGLDVQDDAKVTQEDGFAESLLQILGAKTVDSYDYSDYERATHTHDFNEPLEERFKNKYSLVIDGGSLEHIFNFPVAIRNLMEMVDVGGTVISSVPVNNQSGHGFYQISPELYFRIFCEENGFKVIDLLVYQAKKSRSEIYSVIDPKKLGRRVSITGLGEANICVIAKKIAKREIFNSWPLQSDYQVMWKSVRSKDKVLYESSKKLKNRLWHKLFKILKKHSPIIVDPYTAYKKIDI